VNIAARNVDKLFAQAVRHHQAGQAARRRRPLSACSSWLIPDISNSLYNAGLIGVQNRTARTSPVDLIGQSDRAQ